MINSKIEWCTHTHNFWHGCTKVSEACRFCYAEGISHRFQRVKFGKGEPRWRPSSKTLDQPLAWNKQAILSKERPRVFTLSMGDFFDPEVDPAWRQEAWEMIRRCGHLDWLILSKRPELISGMLPEDWGEGWKNVWLGTTVETQKWADTRIPILSSIPANRRFLSVEPLLEQVDLDLQAIDWVIVGGESGNSPRGMKATWVRRIRDQCLRSSTLFFFKQWGGRSPKKAGRQLDGMEWNQIPA